MAETAEDRFLKSIEERVAASGIVGLKVNKGLMPVRSGGLETGTEQQVTYIKEHLVQPAGHEVHVNPAKVDAPDAGVVVLREGQERQSHDEMVAARTETVRFDYPLTPTDGDNGVVMSGVRVEPAKPAPKTSTTPPVKR